MSESALPAEFVERLDALERFCLREAAIMDCGRWCATLGATQEAMSASRPTSACDRRPGERGRHVSRDSVPVDAPRHEPAAAGTQVPTCSVLRQVRTD